MKCFCLKALPRQQIYKSSRTEVLSDSRRFDLFICINFYCAPQCSHCKRCTSYGNSAVCLSVRLSVRHTLVLCQNVKRKFINGRSCERAVKIWLKIALNAVRLPKFEPVNGISWSPRKIMVKDLRQRSGLALFCACAEIVDQFSIVSGKTGTKSWQAWQFACMLLM